MLFYEHNHDAIIGKKFKWVFDHALRWSKSCLTSLMSLLRLYRRHGIAGVGLVRWAATATACWGFAPSK